MSESIYLFSDSAPTKIYSPIVLSPVLPVLGYGLISPTTIWLNSFSGFPVI
jgi:hypothetical protein